MKSQKRIEVQRDFLMSLAERLEKELHDHPDGPEVALAASRELGIMAGTLDWVLSEDLADGQD